jgi:PEP-CTERM motif
MLVQASPVLIVGTPEDSQLKKPAGLSPNLGGTLINFDNLTTSVSCDEEAVGCPTFNPSTFVSQGITSISSPDGLIVLPFSTQSGPNELFDNSSNGTANITISLARGTSAIGIGIADSDGEVDSSLTITIQALNSTGGDLGSAFVENLMNTESAVNTGNGYYVVEDTTPDIFGLQITQNVANVNFSGLAIDDLQVAPEPSSFLLLGAGVATLAFFRLRKRA